MLKGLFAAMSFLLLASGTAAKAAEIRVLSLPGIKAPLEELAPQFERASGHKLAIRFEIFTLMKAPLEAGAFDVAIYSKSVIDTLEKQGRLAAGASTNIARTSIGVAVRSGAAKPDIGTADAFKRTLLAAKTITYTDGSETGNYVTRMLDRLGIAAEIKPKATLQPGGGRTAPSVARGEAELAIVLVSDILATPGVDLVGPLPAELQNFVVQTAGIGAAARDVAAAKAFIDFLNTAQSGAVFKAKGLEPGAH